MKLQISIIALFLFSVASLVTTVNAQQDSFGIQGAEKPLYKKYDESTQHLCYVYEKFVVKAISSPEDTGDDIFIFKRPAGEKFQASCSHDPSRAYMKQLTTDNSAFFGLMGNLFFVDNGTSAGERGLDIVSLTTKKVIHSISYYEDPKLTENALVYNKYSNKKGSLKVCPEARKWRKNGGDVGWVQPTRLDLKTLRETPVGTLKCVYLE